MKWILCGKNDAAVDALEFLVAHGDEVLVVANGNDDGVDGWQRSLVAAAARLGVPCHPPGPINASATIEALREFGADALVSIQYDQILRDALFNRIGCPCLNLHFALLPRHRGVAPIAWAVLEGDSEAGVTLHHMVEDIDCGDIVAQQRVAIGPTTTARELYDALTEAAGTLFRASYPFDRNSLSQRLPQETATASYHKNGDLDFSELRVDWSRPAAELQCWIRAMIFPPMQYPEVSFEGRIFHIVGIGSVASPASTATTSLPPTSETAPGTVIACENGKFTVSAGAESITGLELVEHRDEKDSSSKPAALPQPGNVLA